MTINRLITSLVQLMLVGGVTVCVSIMWNDLKHDIKEMKKEFKK